VETAFQERMRYHVNRIAQTELHHAYMDKQAEEIMADDSVEVLKMVMSASHPRTDICDLFSKQDKYGLGPGLYPKESAPKPPFHLFCRCVLHSKRLLKAKVARENPARERQCLRDQGMSEGAKAIGGRAKLQEVLNGADVAADVNINRPTPYRLGRVADSGDNTAMKAINNAYESAKAGGRHGGLYSRNIKTRTNEIEKSIRSLQNQIALHEDKIRNPRSFVRNDASDEEVSHLVNSYWPKEILNFKQQAAVLGGIIAERAKHE